MKRSYKKLELDKVLELLANQAWSDTCRDRLLMLEPSFSIDEIKEEIGKTDDAFVLSSKFGTPRFYKIKDVCASAKHAQSGALLSLRELMDIGLVLHEISGLCDWRSQCESLLNKLEYYFNLLTPNKPLEETISNSIISEEEISDDASPELSRIRKTINRRGMQIREQLDKIIKSQNNQKFLQEALITQRDGRYVVPVKVEHKNEISGLVHDTSASGATLFIEPMAVVEANNDIRVLKCEEQAEIERIVRDMSNRVGEFADLLIESYNAAIELEMRFAKSNLAAKMKATTPEICEDAVLELKKARHPLINSETVVPITITLGTNYTSLIVTGPNTGGKTVAIKTAGLLALMTMCGMLIPVTDGSKVGVFDDVLADIGDEQSIEQSLSTFSSHMTNIIRIMKRANEKTLVLIDELGSGTDPIEGAALAVSILTYLKNKGCRVIATTHYQEVKMFAIETDGVENACCEFDVNTLQPTYKLIVGVPGKSNAFAIAQRLGMRTDVIDSAKALVSDENKRFEKVVEELEKSRQELEKLKESIAIEERKTRDLTSQMEEQRAAMEKDKEHQLDIARQKAMSIVEEVRFNADLLMEDLEKLKKEKDKADFSQKVINARSQTKQAMNKMFKMADPVVERKKEKYKLPRELKLKDTVKLMDIGQTGTVVSLPDPSGNLFVQIGMIKTKTKLDNLQLVEETAAPAKSQKKKTSGVSKQLQSNMNRKSSMEIDIRGMMTDEGIMEVDKFIDNCILGGIKMITIIHGKGTGALRAAVHQYLKTNKAVKSYRLGVYGEGEAGVTVVELE